MAKTDEFEALKDQPNAPLLTAVVPSRVLAVDDEPTILDLLEFMFNGPEWDTVLVGDAEAALERCRWDSFDLIIVDKNLPGMSGVELIRRIREDDDAVGIMMVTGYASIETALLTLNLGVDRYLEKPFEVSELMREAREVLTLAAQRRDERERVEEYTARASGSGAYPTVPRSLDVYVAARAADVQQTLAGYMTARDTVHPVRSVAKLLAGVGRDQPDVVVCDADFDPQGVVGLVQDIRSQAPHTECIIVGDVDDLDVVKRLIELRVAVVSDAADTKVAEQWVDAVVSYLRTTPRGLFD